MCGLSLNRKLNGSRYISYVTSRFPRLWPPWYTHWCVETRRRFKHKTTSRQTQHKQINLICYVLKLTEFIDVDEAFTHNYTIITIWQQISPSLHNSINVHSQKIALRFVVANKRKQELTMYMISSTARCHPVPAAKPHTLAPSPSLGRVRVVGIATSYGLDGPGIE
jgi:hypothetical protein